MNGANLYGLMIECCEPGQVLNATRRAWEAGYRDMDAYTPYPVEGLAIALGMKTSRIPSVVFCGAMAGGAVGFLMQYYSMAIDYPFDVGGRPLNSWPAFVPVAFEALVLVAALSGFVGMLLLNRLPRPYHPVFAAPGFERASQDRFFLCIEATDPLFDPRETKRLLAVWSPSGQVIEVFEQPQIAPDEPPERGTARLVPEPRIPATQAGDR
jgi:hypothetical protein